MSSDKIVFPKIDKTILSVRYQNYTVVLFFHINGIIKYYNILLCCKTSDYAVKYAKSVVEKIGLNHPISIHIIPVSYWNSININFKEMVNYYNQEEANLKLNDLMKNYLDTLNNESDEQKKRREASLAEQKVMTGKYYDPNVGIENANSSSSFSSSLSSSDINNEPEQSKPEQSQSEQSEPEQSEPEQSEPKQSEPEQLEPKQSEPKQSEPEQQSVEELPNKPAKNYLTVDSKVDSAITSSNYYIIQFLNPNCFNEDVRQNYSNEKYYGIKIKEFFDNYEDAVKKCEYYAKKDRYYDNVVCDVNEWYELSADTSNSKMSDRIVYQESALNDMMQAVEQTEKQAYKNNLVNLNTEDNGEEDIINVDREDNNGIEQSNYEKPDPEKLLLEKLEKIKLDKQEKQNKMKNYEENKKIMNEKINEIEILYQMLTEDD